MGGGRRDTSSDNSLPAKEQALIAGSFKPTHASHKLVEAHPIAAAEFEADGSGKVALKGGGVVTVPPGFASRGVPKEGDFLVRYAPTESEPDGYLSHSPRSIFEDGYRPLSRQPDASGDPSISLGEAQAIVETKTAPRVTFDGIKGAIADVEYFRAKETLTICIITMRNGFHVLGKSACASPENYDQAVGERYAYDDAFRQIWALEAYSLMERLTANTADPVRAA